MKTQSQPKWSPLVELQQQSTYEDLAIDCLAVGLSTSEGSAIQIQEILFLNGEIHQDPQTLQSHCATLIAVWGAVRAPTILDLGDCSCVGRRILLGEPKAGRRFAVHAHPLRDGQTLFVVFSSTKCWSRSDTVKSLAVEFVNQAREAWDGEVDEAAKNPAEAEIAKKLDWYLFTSREIEILKLVALGLSNKQIAKNLGSSPNTVRNQIHTVFRKAGVSNRTELALRAALV